MTDKHNPYTTLPDLRGYENRLPARGDSGMAKWFSGPPPSVGWWPASNASPPDLFRLRYWDGGRWSNCILAAGLRKRQRDGEVLRPYIDAVLSDKQNSLTMRWTHPWWLDP